jgi:hypothetical protein
MPNLHKYKCRNDACPGTGRRDDTGLFLAFNNAPECPFCRSIKIEDWGKESYGKPGPYLSKRASPDSNGMVGRLDKVFRSQAEQHGLSDINNKDGRPAKGYKAPAGEPEYGYKEYNGIQVPIGNDIRTVSGASGVKPVKSAPDSRLNPKSMDAMKGFTQVTAEHKGKA